MNRSLYEINQDYLYAINNSFSVDEETGEIIFDSFDLRMLKDEFQNKVDNIACYIKDLQALSKAIKDEKKALDDRLKANEKKIESLSSFIVSSMQMREMNKLETARNKISFRKSSKVEIVDESLLANKFVKVTEKREADKIAIMEVLKQGGNVSGACLIEKQNLQIK